MKAIVTFQGFTESAAKRSGTEDLYWQVVRNFSNGDDITTAWPMEWTADVEELGRLIARQGIKDVAVISYSHGQSAVCDFAKVCYDLKITVRLWLACDPVYRPAWLARSNWLQPVAVRAMTSKRKIKVPRNIERVASVYQRENRPHGHELVAASTNTIIAEPIKINLKHTDIDHSGVWFDLVAQELTRWSKKP